MALHKRALMFLLITSLLFSGVGRANAESGRLPSRQTGTNIDPPSIAVELAPTQSATTTITVRTAATPIPKVDVLLLFDVTSSMSEELEQAKAEGMRIMLALREGVSDSTFGVASFADFPGFFESTGYAAQYGSAEDYPWRLDQELTQNTGLAQDAIRNLFLHDGQDGPESYSTALLETLGLGWRVGAKHVVVLFGDAPAHDPSFYLSHGGQDYGADPGPDGATNTPDDLTLLGVVGLVRDFGIEIIAINSDSSGDLIAQAGFEYMAAETGGQVHSLFAAEDLADVVVTSLTESTGSIGRLSITADVDYAGWVGIEPPSFASVPGGETRAFTVEVTVPAETGDGAYTFNLDVTGDGAGLGIVPLTVVVGGLTLDSDALIASKIQVIARLSNLEFESEFLEAPLTIPAVTLYADEEAEVNSWVAGLQEDSLTPAELSALHRLTVLEKSFERLWFSSAQAGHIGNTQLAHVVGFGVSVMPFVKHVQSVAGKTVVGPLVNKLAGYGLAKIASILTTVVLWLTERLPDSPEQRHLRTEFLVVMQALESTLENHLKTAGFAKDFTVDFFNGLLEDVLVVPLDGSTTRLYSQRTEDEILRGLEAAKELGSTTLPISRVEADALRVVGAVNAVASDEEGQVHSLANNAAWVEEEQRMLSLTSDFIALGGYVLALTGVGTISAVIGEMVSIVLKAFDAGMSLGLGGDAYYLWFRMPASATTATDRAFDLTSAAAGNEMTPTLVLLRWSPRQAPLPAPASRSVEATRVVDSLRLQGDAYHELLARLAVAVQTNDMEAAQAVAEALMISDSDLSEGFLSARQPVLVVAESLLTKGDPAFEQVYSEFGRSAIAFDTASTELFVLLLGWIVEPNSSEARDGLLERISRAGAAADDYIATLAAALPFADEVIGEPSVLVAGYTLPEDLTLGREADIVLSVNNPGLTAADDVVVTIDSGNGDTAIGDTSATLTTLGAGETASVSLSFVPSSETGLLSVTTTASNGSGTFRIISYVAAASQGGGGLIFALVLGIVVSGGVFIVTRRRRRFAKPVVGRSTSLTVVAGRGTGRTFPLRGQDILIGRGRANTIYLPDAQVSRRHAAIRFAGGQWFVQDQGSAGGTYVNGQRVMAAALHSGDRIRIGQTEFEFAVR